MTGIVCHTEILPSGISLSYVGPSFDEGPLPAFFYFALSAKDSLCTDPFNQPVQALAKYPLRIFSFDIPYHDGIIAPQQALSYWARDFAQGKDPLSPFIAEIQRAIQELLEQNLLLEGRIGVGGLSRGGFIAIHLAARIGTKIKSLLGFAPLTQITNGHDFHEVQESSLLSSLNAAHLAPSLTCHHIRLYSGNRDLRVGTASCFHFVTQVVEAAFEKGVRSPTVELILTPSIGHQGHGTAPEVFFQGAEWMARELGLGNTL